MKPRILIIEDDKSLYRSLAHMLHREGYDLVWTQTGHEALRKSLDEPFDVALLDLNVSDIDSVKAFELLCQLHPFLPVLVLADEHAAGTSLEGSIIDFDNVLTKPVNRTQLIRAIEAVLAESHHDRISRRTSALYATITAP